MATQDRRTPIFIDSHAHLADAAFASDRDAVVERARSAGAQAVICIGESLATAAVARDCAVGNPGFVFYTAGVHPHDAAGFSAQRDIPLLREHAGSGAVAIGECGLDYHYDNSPRLAQLAAFSAQLQLAAETKLPVVVHSRDAEDDTLALVREGASAGAKGVMHCFTGSHALAKAALALGWYISFSGIVTFRRWADDDLLRLIPEDRLLIESDAPYLAPVPFRGKRNEPAWVPRTLEKIAAARRTDPEVLGATTARNTRQLFALAQASAA